MAQARQNHTGGFGKTQHEAVARVREMQDRARQSTAPGNPAFRNWSTDPNVRRRGPASLRQEEPARAVPPPAPEPKPAEQPFPPRDEREAEGHRRPRGGSSSERKPPPPPGHAGPAEPEKPPEKPKDTTVLQDILGGVGLDDDRILILGLILILINDKADTTLILALVYLLL